MTSRTESGADAPGDTPNFELPRYGAIREENWPEYQARGFVPIWNTDGAPRSMRGAQMFYGTEHVYTGDAYDQDEQRPLRHKPGIGLYSDPEGVAFNAELKRERHEQRRRQRESDGGPSSN